MKAEETVMKARDLCLLVCREHRMETLESKDCDGLDCEECQLQAQAEITWDKAIKEVVEQIKANSEWEYVLLPEEQWLYEPTNDKHKKVGVTISAEFWQSKLKEWGI